MSMLSIMYMHKLVLARMLEAGMKRIEKMMNILFFFLEQHNALQ